jgi:UDP-2-acetamido-3-amino-2,3-dideoxy-glucuronate N-acetyltransferase
VSSSSRYIHPAAIVESDRIGAGTRIWAFSHVLEGSSIGDDCNIGDHCYIESGAIVGDRVTIKNSVAVWDGVVLEDGVFVGPAVTFMNDKRPRSPRLPEARHVYADGGWLERTLVRRGATLGGGAVILPGITIGEFGFVAAGALVTRDVPPHALVAGHPARVRGWVCRCGVDIELTDVESTVCGGCGLRLRADGEGVAVVDP